MRHVMFAVIVPLVCSCGTPPTTVALDTSQPASHCARESRLGTNVVTSVCRTDQQRAADKGNAEEFERSRLPGGPTGTGK